MNDSKKYKFHDFFEMMNGVINGKIKNTKNPFIINEELEGVSDDVIEKGFENCIAFLNDLSLPENQDLRNVVFHYNIVDDACFYFTVYADLVVKLFSNRNFDGFEPGKILQKIYQVCETDVWESDELRKLAISRQPESFIKKDVTFVFDPKNGTTNVPTGNLEQGVFINGVKNRIRGFLDGISSIVREFNNGVNETKDTNYFYTEEFFKAVIYYIRRYPIADFGNRANWSGSDNKTQITLKAVELLMYFWRRIVLPVIDLIKRGEEESDVEDRGGYSMFDTNASDDQQGNDEGGESGEGGEDGDTGSGGGGGTDGAAGEGDDDDAETQESTNVDVKSVSDGLNEIARYYPTKRIRDFNGGEFGEINDCVDMIKNVNIRI